MTFLNATLIFGLVASAIPLVLHLISKREPKTVPFPAVRFLTLSYQSNRSRLQVRRWWLLALRMLAIAAVAVTLARPAISRSLSTTWLSIGIVAVLGAVLLIMAAVAYSAGQSKRLSVGLLSAAFLTLLVSLVWGGATAARGPTINLDAQAPAAVAILIDNSPTSAWTHDGESHLQRYSTLAIELLSRLAPTSRVAIIDRSAAPASFSIDMSSAIAKAESLTAREVASPMTSRLDAAIRLVRTSELENRHVFVLTDLAESTWATGADTVRNTLSQVETPVAVTVLDTTSFGAANRHLGLPRLSDQTPPRQTPIPVSIVVALQPNHQTGDNNQTGANVADVDSVNSGPPQASEASIAAEMLLYKSDPALPIIRDDELIVPELVGVDRTSVRLSPGQSSEVVLTIPPLTEGTHHGVIRLVGDDPFALDDKRYFTVRVFRPTPLLVVGSVPEETFQVALAITSPFAWDDAGAEFAIDRIGYEDFLATRLDDYSTVLLLDPPSDVLSNNSLGDFVSRGGGLLVCLGPAADLPTVESPVIPKMLLRWRVPNPGTFLQIVRASHPALAPLEDVTGGVPWNQFLVQQYWQLEVAETDSVLIQYASTEHAALVERILSGGQTGGRCLVLSTPLPALAGQAKSWNQLFASEAWPAFFLVRDLVGYLSGRDLDRSTTTVGPPQVVRFEAATRSSQNDPEVAEAPNRIQLFAPGRSTAVPLDPDPSSPEVVISEVVHSGTYWLRGDDMSSGFSANLPEESAIFRRIETSQLDDWFGADRYVILNDVDEIDFARGGQAQSILLQSPAMLLALIVFLLEQILSNRFYRTSAGKDAANVKAIRVTRKGMSPV